MQIKKCRGMGSIIDSAFVKSAQTAPRRNPGFEVVPGSEETIRPGAKPQLNTGTPATPQGQPDLTLQPSQQAQQPAGPQAPQPGNPAKGQNNTQNLMSRQWAATMRQHQKEMMDMTGWVSQMAKAPMVQKNPQFVQALQGLGVGLGKLEQNPQLLAEVKGQADNVDAMLESFWQNWEQTVQRGQQSLNMSANKLRSFKEFLGKLPAIKGPPPQMAPQAPQA